MKIARTLATSAAILLAVAAPDALGADHGDTPTLGGVARHDLNITDLHVFTTGDHDQRLVIALSTNDAIPNVTRVTNPDGSVGYRGNVAYQFPSDLQIQVLIDAHSQVTFADPSALAVYGGTIVDPAHVGADVQLTITFDANGAPSITGGGFKDPGTASAPSPSTRGCATTRSSAGRAWGATSAPSCSTCRSTSSRAGMTRRSSSGRRRRA